MAWSEDLVISISMYRLFFSLNAKISQASTCVNSNAFASGSRVKIAGLPDRLSV